MHKFLAHLKSLFFQAVKRFYLGRRIRGVLQFVHGVEVREGLQLAGLQNVLVLAPHPDDESIGCGGTLRALTRAGVGCDVLFMTYGELSFVPFPGQKQDLKVAIANKKLRAAEACALLGVDSVLFLEASDGLLHESLDKVPVVVELIKSGKYQRIFCPWVHDAHPDHAITFRMLQLALQKVAAAPEVWLYEVWSPLIANRIVPIDDTMGDKIKAISMYQDKHEPTDYVWRFLGLAKYRSLLARSSSFAEAFLALDKAMLLDLPFPKPFFAQTIMQPAQIPERMNDKSKTASL